MQVNGKVYLVGAGPGSPDLLTLRAANVLAKADVLLYDRLVHQETIDLVPANCERRDVGKIVGKNHEWRQNQIHQLMVQYAKAGKQVVRLKGGDPFVYGRGSEEIQVLLEHDIAYELIPGLSSSLAGPALAEIPLTHRGVASSFGVFTPSTGKGLPESDLRWAAQVDTAVFLMGVHQLSRIVQDLLASGKDPQTPFAVIERASWADQKVTRTTLGQAEQLNGEIQAPAILVVGETVNIIKKQIKEGRSLEAAS